MTTVRSSRRSSGSAALAFALVLVATASTSAHRRDEYLQAARLGIDQDRVELALDLTPGIAVAPQVLAAIDRDGDKAIAPAEARAYALQVLSAIALDVDGRPLRVELVDSDVPSIDAVLNGIGTMRVRAYAAMRGLGGGFHQLHYRNSHRRDIAVYLANALVPASDRVTIGAQRRDFDQRALTITFMLQADRTTQARAWLFLIGASIGVWIAVVWWRRAAPRVATQ
jgi:hypothetical protein